MVRALHATRKAKGVLLRWQTGTEAGILGFNLYRELGDKRLRLNRALVLTRGVNAEQGYSFLDRLAPPGRLRYLLQAVVVSGGRTWAAWVQATSAAQSP
jgi:hypothetical protein